MNPLDAHRRLWIYQIFIKPCDVYINRSQSASGARDSPAKRVCRVFLFNRLKRKTAALGLLRVGVGLFLLQSADGRTVPIDVYRIARRSNSRWRWITINQSSNNDEKQIGVGQLAAEKSGELHQ
jgi:hypothetical protein